MNISPSWPGTYLHEYCYGFLHIATDTVLAQSLKTNLGNARILSAWGLAAPSLGKVP